MKVHELVSLLEQYDRDSEVFLESKYMPLYFQGTYVLLSTIIPNGVENMQHYRVSYKESPGDRFTFVFVCWADDQDGAMEQCRKAYPGCEVLGCVEIEP